MKIKSLLVAAAALAVGVCASQAQTVYSANIVGYVNTTLAPGFTSLENPLDASGGNSLTNIVPNVGGALDGTLVYVWGGSGYSIYTIDSGMSTGLGNSSDTAAVASPTLNPGTLFYIANQSSSNFTNTFVGTVHVEGTGTGSVGVATNTLPPGYTFVASKIPVAGGVSSVLGLTNTGGALDGNIIYVPNINGSGVFVGYNIVTFDSGYPTGFGNSSDTASAPEPVIPVGGGFIFLNTGSSPITWAQSF